MMGQKDIRNQITRSLEGHSDVFGFYFECDKN